MNSPLFFPSYTAQDMTEVWERNSCMVIFYRNLPLLLLFKCLLVTAIALLMFGKVKGHDFQISLV